MPWQVFSGQQLLGSLAEPAAHALGNPFQHQALQMGAHNAHWVSANFTPVGGAQLIPGQTISIVNQAGTHAGTAARAITHGPGTQHAMHHMTYGGQFGDKAIFVKDAVFTPCFPAGTPITLEDGTHCPIEDIQPGMRVMQKDPATEKESSAQVTHTRTHGTTMLAKVATSSGRVITCTADHPFYLPAKQAWASVRGSLHHGTVAQKLAVGDLLLTSGKSGKARDKISSIELIPMQSSVAVCSLTTQGHHCYFAEGVLVHNNCFMAGVGLCFAAGAVGGLLAGLTGEQLVKAMGGTVEVQIAVGLAGAAAGGAAAGALVGSFLPVIGTSVGAVVGAIGGLVAYGIRIIFLLRSEESEDLHWRIAVAVDDRNRLLVIYSSKSTGWRREVFVLQGWNVHAHCQPSVLWDGNTLSIFAFGAEGQLFEHFWQSYKGEPQPGNWTFNPLGRAVATTCQLGSLHDNYTRSLFFASQDGRVEELWSNKDTDWQWRQGQHFSVPCTHGSSFRSFHDGATRSFWYISAEGFLTECFSNTSTGHAWQTHHPHNLKAVSNVAFLWDGYTRSVVILSPEHGLIELWSNESVGHQWQQNVLDLERNDPASEPSTLFDGETRFIFFVCAKGKIHELYNNAATGHAWRHQVVSDSAVPLLWTCMPVVLWDGYTKSLFMISSGTGDLIEFFRNRETGDNWVCNGGISMACGGTKPSTSAGLTAYADGYTRSVWYADATSGRPCELFSNETTQHQWRQATEECSFRVKRISANNYKKKQ